ncbi:mannitol dehydrogenase family protein [Lacimicrobium alkaliphilum]|uniref:Mannitol dehydrogenase n=1 Tax=Lacimicrobium alkaliphilum TaxID=1526571 RepID=A0A0U3AWI1_9ALTE|nr:mannitol dehydrogenase family protein [Lacimicrobium alkaliphilum]ALS97320.1 mannitol dehydrogenase [Lacimicrobium alkaliphilum]
MSLLNQQSLTNLPDAIKVPGYNRAKAGIGIVHLGPGAFHRAHQAVFTDDALALGGDWAISAVSMRSKGLRDSLKQQQNLYTLAVLDHQSRYQVIGAIKEVLVLDEDRTKVMERLTAATTHIVTLTVTEKGYCLNGQGLLALEHKDIRHDLANPGTPISAIGLLVLALKQRFEKGHEPLTIISCDNLADNGHKLAQAVLAFAAQSDTRLAARIADEVSFPCTMVDSITPATDEALIEQVADALGVEDQWPVQREAFSQWVIEDKFSGPRPPWDQVGVTFTADVSGYENAKLRLLNGSHSTLAYLGLGCGYETVYQAMQNPHLQRFVQRLFEQEIIPSLKPPAELDLHQYSRAILERYANPHIRHMLSQIAWDGSQKLPFRLLRTINDNLAADRSISRLCVGVAAWLQFLVSKARTGAKLTDPLAAKLLEVARGCDGNAAADVQAFLALSEVFVPELSANQVFVEQLTQGYQRLSTLSADSLGQILGDLL